MKKTVMVTEASGGIGTAFIKRYCGEFNLFPCLAFSYQEVHELALKELRSYVQRS